jgi:CubicO group peptidase (beta-lactamase class C family)
MRHLIGAAVLLLSTACPVTYAAAATQAVEADAGSGMGIVPQHGSYFPSDVELRELLQTLVEQGEAKGIVVGLLEPDGRRRIVSYGDAGTGARPLSSKTVFEIGSITKTFTNTILADMVRKGEVSLDDPVQKHLPPGVEVPSRSGRQITLLDLATHTSGLPRVPTKIPDPSNPFAHYQVQHLYEFLSDYELEREVGAEPVYSNLGAGLLGHALAKAAGVETLGDLVRERITEPLKMNMTAYGRDGELGAWMAKGHDEKGEQVPYWDVAVLSGAGGLNSNVEDMLTYVGANVGPPSSPLQAAMGDAHRPRRNLKTDGFSVGLGWQQRTREGQTIVHHGGGTGGFQTYLGFDPATGAGVVIMGNSAEFDARDDVVFQLLKDRKLVSLAAHLQSQYVGTFRLWPELSLSVSSEQGRLYGQVNGQPRVRLYSNGNDRFFSLASEAEVAFARDAQGSVSSATLT